MRFTDNDGRELTVEFVAEPEALFGNDFDHDPDWADAALRLSGDEMLIVRMNMLLQCDSVKVDEPFRFETISKQYPRDAVITAAVAMFLTPDTDSGDWTVEDADIWDRLYRSTLRGGLHVPKSRVY